MPEPPPVIRMVFPVRFIRILRTRVLPIVCPAARPLGRSAARPLGQPWRWWLMVDRLALRGTGDRNRRRRRRQARGVLLPRFRMSATLRDRFRGCLLGAMIGDVAGAVVEAELPAYVA